MKTILFAALCAATVAHAQTSWKLATGYRAESFHTENIVQFAREVATATQEWVRSVGHQASDLFVPFYFN